MTNIRKLLIIEDSEEIVEAVSMALCMRWPNLKIFSTDQGEEGIELVEKNQPDIVILDIALPDISGFDVLKQVRLFSNVPIIILSVKKDESDVIKGLELGADEYVYKPFRQMELVSRIMATVRRHGSTEEDRIINAGIFIFDPQKRALITDSDTIKLTRTESIILGNLMRNKGNIVTHNKLAEEIWGSDYPDASLALKVHVKRLRDKIEPDSGNPRYILNRPGIGYFFALID
jgi:two-component system KDP operon response regulator KdpE